MVSEPASEKYEVVIGLEVHAQLLCDSKIFASDGTTFGQSPNTLISPITLGHPGTLPKLNKKAVEYAIRMGLACGCEITREMGFDRKNYFYPDLPKGYQITQDKGPICVGGQVSVRLSGGECHAVQLNRIHLEEDAGKSIHLAGEAGTLVDFNRAGMPLIEIVTEPTIRSSEEAFVFLSEIKKIVKYLEICDANMEEGSLRCDANVSVRLRGESTLGKKVEVKNMNSFRNVVRAIDYEHARMIQLLEEGKEIISETRTFDATTGKTSGMRTKEELNDYRYFPEPDLSPIHISEDWLQEIQGTLPTLPWEMHQRLVESFGLPEYDAAFLSESKEMADWFLELCKHTSHYKLASNWMMGPVKSFLNEQSETLEDFPISPKTLASLLELVAEGKLSHFAASQKLFPELLRFAEIPPLEMAQRLNLIQESDEESIRPQAMAVLTGNPEKVKAYQSGKKGLMGFFMGQVMQKTKGKADPKVATKLLEELLKNN